MNILIKFFALFLLIFSIACTRPTVSQQQPHAVNSIPVPTPETKDPSKTPVNINTAFVDADTLTHGDYTIEKLTKKVRIEQTEGPVEVSYAVLKRKGKVLATFDGVYSGMGNLTDFGQFAFLGSDDKQLIVSQTIPRGGRHWIVSLSSDFRVIFDSADYNVGREDLSILDIDKDGKYELLLEDIAMYGLKLPPSETPLPLVIFKYDEKAGKYIPASHLFKEYSLKKIKSEINTAQGSTPSKVLDITLQYIYAGEEQTGWRYFDKEYTGPDKEKVRSEVKNILKKHPFY